MISSSRLYAIVIASTLFYTINGVVDFVVIKNLGIGLAALYIGIGMLIGVIFSIPLFKMRLRLKKTHYYAFGAISALLIVLYNLLLFIAYINYTLASIYPLIGLSALIFLVLDLALYRKSLPKGIVSSLLIAVALVVFGVFFAESAGFQFDIDVLPFVFGISIFAGIGYYMEYYKIEKYSIGSKIVLQPFILIIAALFFIKVWKFSLYSIYPYIGIAGGFSFILAVSLELHAMKMSNTISIKKTVISRNMINDFGYADTLFVLIGSIIIGSFTCEQIFGGLLIFTGVIMLAHLRQKSLK